MNERFEVIRVLVKNNPAVLARISSLFARKGFNIDTLTASLTNQENLVNITITVNGDENDIRQILNQTFKLEDVVEVKSLDKKRTVMREIMLMKVKSDSNNRSQIREIAEIYKASIVDLSPNSLIIELTGKQEKIDGFIKVMNDYEIIELCRTGITAMER